VADSSIPPLIPQPDPTKLTTEAVDRLHKELDNVLNLRFDGLRQIYAEKFKGVATEFTMRDIALAAAFKAAEAAVKQQNESNTLAADKAASAFTKQIDTLDEKINDLKERMAHLSQGNWAAVGGYLIGALGVIALVVTIISRIHI
jgi:hypothetical protein